MLTFDQFKSKLEDQCLFAINSDNKRISSIGTDQRCCCPLGTIGYSYPSTTTASETWDISWNNAAAFIHGFSGFKIPRRARNSDIKYYDLGMVYRKKFG